MQFPTNHLRGAPLWTSRKPLLTSKLQAWLYVEVGVFYTGLPPQRPTKAAFFWFNLQRDRSTPSPNHPYSRRDCQQGTGGFWAVISTAEEGRQLSVKGSQDRGRKQELG